MTTQIPLKSEPLKLIIYFEISHYTSYSNKKKAPATISNWGYIRKKFGFSNWLPEREGNTNFFPTVVYILQKNIWAEKRYSLSNDIPPDKVKNNPIRKAKKIETLIAKNSNISKARIARGLQMSRARVTQILNLLKIDPEIQEQVLQSKETYTERQLRPIMRLKCFEKQRQLFSKTCPHFPQF